MTGGRRLRRSVRKVAALIAATVVIVVLVMAALVVVIQTPWGKNQLRALAVRQANRALAAHLDIGRLEGSLFHDVTLRDIRLQQDGRTVVAIDAVSVSYSLRQLWKQGVFIDRVHLVAPRITARKMPDGRWDLATLVKSRAQEERKGPARSVHIGTVQIDDGTIVLGSPVAFGAAHIPTRYEHLNTRFGFDSGASGWTLRFDSMSWTGTEPDLTIEQLSGSLGNSDTEFVFDRLHVVTPRTAFSMSGPIRHEHPARLDLEVHADRFAFQEWSGIVPGLRNIAVEAAFDVALHGPVTAMATNLQMKSSAGSIAGRLVLDTSIPGWSGRGTVDVGRLDLAGWLNRPDRPSNITGQVAFDLALRLGEGFPRGRYQFHGPHAGFMEYGGDDVDARGTIEATRVVIESAVARAYGGDVRIASGTIGIDDPYPFRFAGTAARVDLRRLPKSVPVPHVDSTLAFDYDVRGRFAEPFITGTARLSRSVFVGAIIADGTVGNIDTSVHPLRYGGSGEISNVDLARFGEALDIATLREPRYRGTVSGRFTLDASGTTGATLDLHASGRVSDATAFNGHLSDANVALDIAGGTLSASYDGGFDAIDPSVPLVDPQFHASLSGNGRVHAVVRDLMLSSPTPADYDIDWDITFDRSEVRGIDVDRAHAAGRFRDAMLTLDSLDVSAPAGSVKGAGTLALTETGTSDFQFTVDRADLGRVGSLLGRKLAGQLTTQGRLTGPRTLLHVSGKASALDFAASGVSALSASGDYDVDLPSGDPLDTSGKVSATAEFVSVAKRELQHTEGTIALAHRTASLDVRVEESPGRNGAVRATVGIGADRHSAQLDSVTIDFGGTWQLARTPAAPVVRWNADAISVEPLAFVGGPSGTERITVGGTWQTDGRGAIHVVAAGVRLESFERQVGNARYAGTVDADVTLTGTRASPIVTGTIKVADGRVDRFPYQQLAGRVDYVNGAFNIDFRLDQSPDTWATVNGRLPLALFDRSRPEAPIDVRLRSSPIELGLLNGLTSVVTNVSGQGVLDVHVIGTSRDPHFEGRVELSNTTFIVAATGVAYNRVAAVFALARDRITVESLHVEDTSHHTLDLHGSLATHELKVGDLEVAIEAHDFTVMQSDLGRVAINATLDVGGRFEQPTLEGDISVASGSLNVDAILEQTLFRPYSTQEVSIAPVVDPVAALNPWDRLRLNLTLHVPETLRLVGQNVQVSPGTPIGLGDIGLRVGGDLVLLKEPGARLGVYGSFDTITGTFTFQGRRFDIDPTSSINFRGGFSPEVYVTVMRDISGVEARVTITGPLDNPELRLTSTPPLEASDILSLIVFNTSLNNLNVAQQQQLVVRAGTIAAGFLATPLVQAVQSRLGLDILEVSTANEYVPGSVAPKVTVGGELAPGLFARFSQQFGEAEYSQVEIEYYLTRILRLRATFSDAGALAERVAPFQLVERGGVDLLVFFSF